MSGGTEGVVRSFRKDLRVLEREITRSLKGEGVACCGVTLAQCHLLLEVRERGTTSVTELASSLELDKSTLSRTVDGMCRARLLSRRTDPRNRRRQVIGLTEKGRAAADSINEMCDRYYGRMLEAVPARKRQMAIESVALVGQAMREMRRAEWIKTKAADADVAAGKRLPPRRRRTRQTPPS